MLRDRGDRLGAAAALDQCLDQVLRRRCLHLVEARRLADRPLLVGELVERGAARDRQCGTQGAAAGVGGRQPSRVDQRLIEALGVDRCRQLVAARGRHQRVGTKSAPQPGDAGPQPTGREVEHFRQPLGPHGVRCVHGEDGEQPPLAGARQLDGASGGAQHLDRSEHPDDARATFIDHPIHRSASIAAPPLPTLSPGPSAERLRRNGRRVGCCWRVRNGSGATACRAGLAISRERGSTRAARPSARATGSPATPPCGTVHCR